MFCFNMIMVINIMSMLFNMLFKILKNFTAWHNQQGDIEEFVLQNGTCHLYNHMSARLQACV